MRRMIAAVLALGTCFSGSAIGAEREVTLRVENMYCASCPFIVKQTLASVPGVAGVDISYQEAAALALAVVRFEDTETDVDALTTATAEIGFPSRLSQ